MSTIERFGAALVLGAFALALASVIAPAPAVPARRPGSPFAASVLPAAQRFAIEGDVEERLDAGPYVYLRVRDDRGASHWLASLDATASTSDRIRAHVLGRAEGFESRRLERRFDTLLFAIVRAADPAPPRHPGTSP